jgi:small neutral amino acid transporter SnatA (MarC family)
MVVAKDSGFHSTTAGESKEAFKREDVSVFPLAIPLIAGPGALIVISHDPDFLEQIRIDTYYTITDSGEAQCCLLDRIYKHEVRLHNP